MGVRLFAWLGGLAWFLATALFIKYSFEAGRECSALMLSTAPRTMLDKYIRSIHIKAYNNAYHRGGNRCGRHSI
jgi:hypothetical protein